MDNMDAHCEYITIQEVEDKGYNTDKYGNMISISKHKITNTIEFMLLADDTKEIIEIVLPEG